MNRLFHKKKQTPEATVAAGEQGAMPGVSTPGAGSGTTPLFEGTPMREVSEGSLLGYGGGASHVHTSPSSISDASSSLQRQTAYEIMAETLFRYAQRERLFSDNPAVWNGVALRLSKGKYVCSPQHDPRLLPWISGLTILNCDVSVTNIAEDRTIGDD